MRLNQSSQRLVYLTARDAITDVYNPKQGQCDRIWGVHIIVLHGNIIVLNSPFHAIYTLVCRLHVLNAHQKRQAIHFLERYIRASAFTTWRHTTEVRIQSALILQQAACFFRAANLPPVFLAWEDWAKTSSRNRHQNQVAKAHATNRFARPYKLQLYIPADNCQSYMEELLLQQRYTPAIFQIYALASIISSN